MLSQLNMYGITTQKGKKNKAKVKHSFSPPMVTETAKACDSEDVVFLFFFTVQMNRCIFTCLIDLGNNEIADFVSA